MSNLAGLVGVIPMKITAESSPRNSEAPTDVRWYALRDLKRPNATLPAYKQLSGENLEVFTPMKWTLSTKGGRRVRILIPVMQDLLFVHASLLLVEPIVRRINTLQFRFDRGGYCKPLIIPEDDMTRFIRAVSSSENPKYFMPGELTEAMCGRAVRIIGGPLNGYEGNLLKIRGSRIRRLIVELPNFITAGVEVQPEYIQFIDRQESKSCPAKSPAK